MRRLDWGAVGGLAFVALNLIEATALLNTLDSHASKAEFASYYGHFRGTSHEWRELLGTFVATLAAFAFAWFLRRLRAILLWICAVSVVLLRASTVAQPAIEPAR